MNKLRVLAAMVAIALLSGAWVIKESKSNEPMDFYTSPSGTPTKALTISGTTSNVGIGTATPGAKLDVNGAVNLGPSSGNTTHTVTAGSGTVNLHIDTTNTGSTAAVLRLKNSSGAANDIFRIAHGGGVTKFTDGTPTTVGQVDLTSNGAWTFGSTSGSITHAFQSGGSTQLRMVGSGSSQDFVMIRNGANSGGFTMSASGNGTNGTLTFANGTAASPGSNTVGTIDGSGNWILGQSSNGAVRFGATTQAGVWGDTASGATSCNAQCAANDSSRGFHPAAGACLMAWRLDTNAPINANGATACSDTTSINKRCLCCGSD